MLSVGKGKEEVERICVLKTMWSVGGGVSPDEERGAGTAGDIALGEAS